MPLQGAARNVAKVAELVDALDLGSSGVSRESSSLSFRTKIGGGVRAAHAAWRVVRRLGRR